MYEKLKGAIDEIIAAYKEVYADKKITFGEMLTLVTRACATFVKLVESMGEGTGQEKKDAVITAVGTFYDTVVAPMDIPGVPNFIEPMVDQGAKLVAMTVASSAVDALVVIFNKTGWGEEVEEGQVPQAVKAPVIY
jgi:hypothetical protein